jgi:hypothetical protein
MATLAVILAYDIGLWIARGNPPLKVQNPTQQPLNKALASYIREKGGQ